MIDRAGVDAYSLERRKQSQYHSTCPSNDEELSCWHIHGQAMEWSWNTARDTQKGVVRVDERDAISSFRTHPIFIINHAGHMEECLEG
jgi:hypothetical protein